MSKAKIYKINGNKKFDLNNEIVSFGLEILVYAIILMIATSIFKGIYVENFFWAIIASIIINLLNYSVKPILIYWTLPLNILTCGIAYPIVNIIILKLCDILLGTPFMIKGFFSAFIIAIFISIMKLLLDKMITKRFGRG